MNVQLYAPMTQCPGANPTLNVSNCPSPTGAIASNAALGAPEERILAYAQRLLSKPKAKEAAFKEQEHLNSMEVTGMSHFKAVTQFVVQEGAFEQKVQSELKANKCPDHIADAITQHIMSVEREMKVNVDCQVKDGNGTLFKIAWCMERDAGRARVSFMVFGASFSAKTVDHYETEAIPVFKEVPVTERRGWLWNKTTVQTIVHKQVGTKEVRTPSFKTMTGAQVAACMDFLELKAAEKVLETAETNVPVVPEPCVHPHAMSLWSPQVVQYALWAVMAFALSKYAMPAKRAGPLATLMSRTFG